MKIELTSGCTSGGLWIGNKSAYELPSEEVLKILHSLLDKAEPDTLVNVLTTVLEYEGEYKCDKEPCEQCGVYTDSYTLMVEEKG